MKRGITITTSEYTKDFLKDCLESIKKTPYDILIVSNGGYNPLSVVQEVFKERDRKSYDVMINSWNGWEIGGIMRGKEKFDEQIHLMDTTVVKDISLFDKLFAIKGNVVLTKGNFHYQAKLVSKETPNLPRVHDKTTAIMLETKWLDGFQYTEFEPDLKVHSNIWEDVHGQNRMRLENEYMIKWKGTAWVSPDQLKELEEEINSKYKQ